CPLDAGDGVVEGAAARVVERLDGVEAGPGRHADHAGAVVGGGDYAGHVAAVTIVVVPVAGPEALGARAGAEEGIARAGDVHEVDAARQVGLEVGVRLVDARID